MRATATETTATETSPALAEREPTTDAVHPWFLARWSPRAFADEPVDDEDLRAVFEAARWAPSSYNEQPWRFAVARTEADRERFLDAVLEGNRAWAARAPVLAFVLAETTFEHDGEPNAHAEFDAGAAWMSLALQAHERGLATHAMGGIDPERAAEVVDASDDHEVVCAVAIGHRAPAETLPDELAERELPPSDRKPLDDVVHEGGFD
jgi:nitroreductase